MGRGYQVRVGLLGRPGEAQNLAGQGARQGGATPWSERVRAREAERKGCEGRGRTELNSREDPVKAE